MAPQPGLTAFTAISCIYYFVLGLLLEPGNNENPGRGGQTEVTPDQTSFERTHVPGALELHGLEKASSALSSGQWSGTCLIRGQFGLGRSDQRQFRAHTSLIRDNFERTLV